MKKKILVLFTGGTIGSVKVLDENTGQTVLVQPSEAKKYNKDAKDLSSLLLSEYNKKFPNGYNNFDTKSIMEKFSEDFTIETLADLTRKLRVINFNDYEGVIITHGTDTLGFTANYLATVLNDVKVPVVLVGSNYPVEDQKANGVINFKAATDYIHQFKIPGVYVAYNNDISLPNTNIIYASRVTQCQSPTDTFNGISCHKPVTKPLGTINLNGEFSITDPELFSKLISKHPQGKSYINHISSLSNNVLLINPFVGINYDNYNLSGDFEVILHTLYHSGTSCTDGNNNETLTSFIKNCNKKGKDIYLGPLYGKSDKNIYNTMKAFMGENIIMNTSPENAYIKLIIAYHLFDKAKQREDFMFGDINEEHISDSYKLEYRKRY